jgi:hypothetical protein
MGQFIEQAGGYGVTALGVGESEEYRVVRGLTLLSAMKSVKPSVELLAALWRAEPGIIGNIVATSHEGVNGAQSFSLTARQD